jgi:hypothetical protein
MMFAMVTATAISCSMGRQDEPVYLSLMSIVQIEQTEAGSLNKRLRLSSSFWCDQIYKYEIYNFGHTLLCYLSLTLMFNKPTSVACIIKHVTIVNDDSSGVSK